MGTQRATASSKGPGLALLAAGVVVLMALAPATAVRAGSLGDVIRGDCLQGAQRLYWARFWGVPFTDHLAQCKQISKSVAGKSRKPTRCVVKELGAVFAEWVVADESCASPKKQDGAYTWSPIARERCVDSGKRLYYSRIWTPPFTDAMAICRGAKATLSGVFKDLTPTRCTSKELGAVHGEWFVDDDTCFRDETSGTVAHWGEFAPGNCKTLTTRTYWSRLWGSFDGDWAAACRATQARVKGLHFKTPTRCVTKLEGVYGEFDIADKSCGNDLKLRAERIHAENGDVIERLAKHTLYVASSSDTRSFRDSLRAQSQTYQKELSRSLASKEGAAVTPQTLETSVRSLSASKSVVQPLALPRSSVPDIKGFLRGRGFNTMTMGVAGDISLLVGAAVETGVSEDLGASGARANYSMVTLTRGLSAGVDGALVAGVWKPHYRDIGGFSAGVVVAVQVKVGGGVGVWFAAQSMDPLDVGEFIGITFGPSVGVGVELFEVGRGLTTVH